MDIEEYSKYKQFYTGEIPELLLKYLNKNDWKNYLDLGCGDGSLLYALNKKGYFNNKNVYAVDLSKNRIDLAKKINKDFICFVGDACNVKDIKENGIDFLVSLQVIEHVDNDKNMIRETNRLLKKGGIFYISTVFKKWYGWYFYKCNRKWALDPTHLREYNKDNQLIDVLNKNSFEVLENKKTTVSRSIFDFILKRAGVCREVFVDRPFLGLIRKIRIPIFGYYNWEIICKKK